MKDYWAPQGGFKYLNDYLPEGRYAFSEEYHGKVTKAADHYEVCIVCGRRTTRERGIGVILGGGGDGLVPLAEYADAERLDRGFLGNFMVGPECGKRIPAEFRVPVKERP